jgi:hypothetical protein
MHAVQAPDVHACDAGSQKTGTTFLYQSIIRHEAFVTSVRRPGCVPLAWGSLCLG